MDVLNLTQSNVLMEMNEEYFLRDLCVLIFILITSVIISIGYRNLTVLMFLIIPLVIFVLAIFCVYKFCVIIALYLKHRSKFSLLKGPDSFWLLRDDSKNYITILMIVNYKSNAHKAFKDHLSDCLIKRIYHINKLFASVHSFMGYQYLLPNTISCNDYINELLPTKYSSESNLQQFLSELQEEPLQNGGLWELLVGNEEINWSRKPSNYPVVVRFNHCLGDGLSLLQLLQSCFADNLKFTPKSQEKEPLMQEIVKITIRCMHFALVLSSVPHILLQKLFIKRADKNVLHGKRLTGRKTLLWTAESTAKHVKTTKLLKNKLHSTFCDVLSSAVCGSVKDLFDKRGDSSGDISVVVPAVPNARQFKSLDSLDGVVNLTNEFSLGELKLPINKIGGVERLGEVMRRTFVLRNSFEYQVNYWLLNIVCAILPRQVLQILISSNRSTAVLSNVPGPSKLCVLNGCKLEDIVCFSPHRGSTGVAITILSYDGRFQIGLNIDQAYGLTKAEAQGIIDGILKHIENLKKETFLYSDDSYIDTRY